MSCLTKAFISFGNAFVNSTIASSIKWTFPKTPWARFQEWKFILMTISVLLAEKQTFILIYTSNDFKFNKNYFIFSPPQKTWKIFHEENIIFFLWNAYFKFSIPLAKFIWYNSGIMSLIASLLPESSAPSYGKLLFKAIMSFSSIKHFEKGNSFYWVYYESLRLSSFRRMILINCFNKFWSCWWCLLRLMSHLVIWERKKIFI